MTGAFTEALLSARRPVIMELKRQDSAGHDLFAGRSVARVVAAYEAAGAPCLSVVTGRWFGGTPDLLREVAEATGLPLLQKDFLTRRSQLVQARESGASAVLLTAALLPRSTLGNLVDHTLGLGLTPFVEVATEEEGRRVPRAGECVVAVNNKDIATRERGAGDIGRSVALLPTLRSGGTRCPVSAGGIRRPEEAARLVRQGFAGVLIGTGLLRAADLPRWLDDFDRCRDTGPTRPPAPPPRRSTYRTPTPRLTDTTTHTTHTTHTTPGGNGMTGETHEQWKVVVNDEEQYSIWSADRESPAGWHESGVRGTKEECLAHIERVWTDMRPRSLRQRTAPDADTGAGTDAGTGAR